MSDNKKISELDNLASGDIANTDLIEIGRTSTKNFKFTWTNIKAALKTYFDTLYTTITTFTAHVATFNDHSARHENDGADEISVAGLDGESTELAAHKADEAAGIHGSTSLATANKLAHRDAAGRMAVADGAADGDVANKGQMDTGLNLKEDVANKKTGLSENSDTYYPSQQAVKEAVDAKADDSDVIKKDGSVAFTGDASMGGHKLTGLGAPVADDDAARKADIGGATFEDYSDVTGTRAIDTIYQNTSGGTMIVLISVALITPAAANSRATIIAKVGSGTPPADDLGRISFTGHIEETHSLTGMMLTMIVPNNYYYQALENLASGGTTNLTKWIEITF